MRIQDELTPDEPEDSLSQPADPSEPPTEEELSDQNLSQVDGAGTGWTVTSFGGTTSSGTPTITSPIPPTGVSPTPFKGS